jgi:SAM-dependent methyltransferase
MPDWETFDWEKWKSDAILEIPKPSVKKVVKKVPKLYQNIPLEGARGQNENRIHSKFWNEGKWNNFVIPHLPEDCTDQTFVDMGCNAGLFLKLAEDRGYRNVVGVEKDKTPVAEGLRYRDSIGYNYKILKRTLGGKFGEGGNFNIDELPVADITVMSTFHYYIDINSWMKYLDRLRTKSIYCLLVSRPNMRRLHWKAYSSHEALKGYFADWEEVGLIKNVSREGDPAPRILFSVLFKQSILERVPIDDIFIKKETNDAMYLGMKDLAKQIITNRNIDPFATDYYDVWVQRKKGRWSMRQIRKFVQDKFNLMLDVMDNGIKDPLIIQSDGGLSDGGHRLVILRALDYKSVIVRRL